MKKYETLEKIRQMQEDGKLVQYIKDNVLPCLDDYCLEKHNYFLVKFAMFKDWKGIGWKLWDRIEKDEVGLEVAKKFIEMKKKDARKRITEFTLKYEGETELMLLALEKGFLKYCHDALKENWFPISFQSNIILETIWRVYKIPNLSQVILKHLQFVYTKGLLNVALSTNQDLSIIRKVIGKAIIAQNDNIASCLVSANQSLRTLLSVLSRGEKINILKEAVKENNSEAVIELLKLIRGKVTLAFEYCISEENWTLLDIFLGGSRHQLTKKSLKQEDWSIVLKKAIDWEWENLFRAISELGVIGDWFPFFLQSLKRHNKVAACRIFPLISHYSYDRFEQLCCTSGASGFVESILQSGKTFKVRPQDDTSRLLPMCCTLGDESMISVLLKYPEMILSKKMILKSFNKLPPDVQLSISKHTQYFQYFWEGEWELLFSNKKSNPFNDPYRRLHKNFHSNQELMNEMEKKKEKWPQTLELKLNPQHFLYAIKRKDLAYLKKYRREIKQIDSDRFTYQVLDAARDSGDYKIQGFVLSLSNIDAGLAFLKSCQWKSPYRSDILEGLSMEVCGQVFKEVLRAKDQGMMDSIFILPRFQSHLKNSILPTMQSTQELQEVMACAYRKNNNEMMQEIRKEAEWRGIYQNHFAHWFYDE